MSERIACIGLGYVGLPVALGFARAWPRPFPLGTLAINVGGSFVLGWFATWAASRAGLDPAWRLAVATGFVGAFTTFSTFEYETRRLAEAGLHGLALLNVAASVAKPNGKAYALIEV